MEATLSGVDTASGPDRTVVTFMDERGRIVECDRKEVFALCDVGPDPVDPSVRVLDVVLTRGITYRFKTSRVDEFKRLLMGG